MVLPSNLRNLTSNQIALILAVSVTIATIVLEIIGATILQISQPMWTLPLLPLAIFGITFVISLYLIRVFVFRRVKILYKMVRSTRKAPGEQYDLIADDSSEDLLSHVEKEVSEWNREHVEEVKQMKELENYRRDYMGNVAHELKTPVFNVQGFIDTLIDTNLEDEAINMRYLKLARQNINRLNTILSDLDLISKLESDQIILDLQKFDIKELVEEVFDDLEVMAESSNISLKFKEKSSASHEVMADRESILQVLTNLITNSIKYGREGGKTLVSFYDMHDYILVEIMDSGIGIAQNHLKHIFDRFYRVDKGRSRSHGGSGLGLSIVKHILESHDETITVRSSPDIGTTFSFTLKKAS